jgi:hypothetical protein
MVVENDPGWGGSVARAHRGTGNAQRPARAHRLVRCNLPWCAGSLGSAQVPASWPRDTRRHESALGRRKSQAETTDGRTGCANRHPPAARSETTPVSRYSTDSSRAGSRSGCCWRSGSGAHTASESPSRSNDRERRISTPPPIGSVAPPTVRAKSPHTIPSGRSWPARQIVVARHLLLIARFRASLYGAYQDFFQLCACEFRQFHPLLLQQDFSALSTF